MVVVTLKLSLSVKSPISIALSIFKVLPDLTETTYRPCVSLNNCAFVISIEDF